MSAVAYDHAQRQTAELVEQARLRRQQQGRRATFVAPESSARRMLRRTAHWVRTHVHLHRRGSGGTPAVPAM
ncbi:hypothetical protein ACFQRL_06070 [Microbacterium fluvii]|uniref:Uncharacterized protein n=1 Tax=Microbacterium fluvii TaxID=415215 RepID=A0ABW2HFH3_9MICO|nr:hypothetical protein [Microbacterium fluvii]MCU4672152.1 hypothetical protein [Microbacterium fluvii]